MKPICDVADPWTFGSSIHGSEIDRFMASSSASSSSFCSTSTEGVTVSISPDIKRLQEIAKEIVSSQNARKGHYQTLFDMVEGKHKPSRYVDASHDENDYREIIERGILREKDLKAKLHSEKRKVQKRQRLEARALKKLSKARYL